ncbi:hypothetical protein [uncultured Nostoc sp.]|uniref:hypothetical protein n=1 Tax=uncultured Nostoc sp. TaxID=340711 RepID=UPI0035CA3549
MAKLPSGIRRVYNALYKLKAGGQMAYTPTPLQIKNYFEAQSFNPDSITDEQFTQTVNHFSKGSLSTELKFESAIVHPTQQEVREIVSNKAIELSLELSSDDINYVADQIDCVNSTIDDILNKVEGLLTAYSDHKKQENIDKIDSMFNRVYNHFQDNNSSTSNHLSARMRSFGKNVEQAQQDLKSSISSTLNRLKI